jgi:hypothetical protein
MMMVKSQYIIHTDEEKAITKNHTHHTHHVIMCGKKQHRRADDRAAISDKIIWSSVKFSFYDGGGAALKT